MVKLNVNFKQAISFEYFREVLSWREVFKTKEESWSLSLVSGWMSLKVFTDFGHNYIIIIYTFP